MIAMYLRTLITKFLFFINTKPPLFKERGRHGGKAEIFPIYNYTNNICIKQQ